jgi:ribosomal protein RSM22 (predicted rRNA methylase)
MTTRSLPPALIAARDRLLEGVSRRDLRERAAELSRRYRTVAGGHARADEVLSYVVTRMPATYAAISAVLDEVATRLPDFAPRSLLDLGSGPGTAAWAAVTTFPGLSSVAMIEGEPAFRSLAAQLAEGHAVLEGATVVASNLETRPEIGGQHDLVTAAFMLAEISPQRLAAVIAGAWAATTGVLVLVEPGTPAGFERIRLARHQVIAAGGHVIAPCSHDAPCPITGNDWCHFAVRLPRDREHRQVKAVDAPFEDEKYAYVALSRTPVPAIAGRILKPPRIDKIAAVATICGKDGITEQRVASRHRDAYRIARTWRWGDAISE